MADLGYEPKLLQLSSNSPLSDEAQVPVVSQIPTYMVQKSIFKKMILRT